MTARDKQIYSIHAVEHALDLLEVLCDEGERAEISNLSEKLGMSRFGIFCLLTTFEQLGYVEKEKGSGRYRLGLSAFETGQRILCSMAMLRQARPVMESLARKCKEAVYFSIPRGPEVLFLYMVDSLLQVRTVSFAGKRFPLAQTSAGHLVMAFSQKGPRPGRSVPMLDNWLSAEEIDMIRNRGYTSDIGGLDEGIVTVSVPLFNPKGALAGCLSLVGPDFRMTESMLEEFFLPHLKEAGEIISFKIGYLKHYLRKNTC